MLAHTSEPVTLTRECEVVRVPSGETTTLPAESFVYITQALGGSFTIYADGNLFRVRGEDGDALGKEPLPGPELPADASFDDVKELVWAQMRTCFDPEIPVNIVDLGLIYECDITEHKGKRQIDVQMTLTAPGCGMGPVIVDDVKTKLKLIPTVDMVNVELTFDPPWSFDRMSDEARLHTGTMW